MAFTTRLVDQGCDSFFTAHLREAIAVRKRTGSATIHVLNGLATADIPLYRRYGITPVLSRPEEVSAWLTSCPQVPAALHIDTGINRLGLTRQDARDLAATSNAALNLSLIMSHLAAADEPTHPLNARQIRLFADITAAFPATPASLANSHGLVHLPESRLDLARPGIALFGGGPNLTPGATNPHVVRFEAQILQCRSVAAGQSIGYGAKAAASRPTTIALAAAGYADGYPRLSRPTTSFAAVNGLPVPLIGTVSMDMLAIDVTDLPAGLARPGEWVELIGPNVHIEQLAASAGTISYDILTKLGPRSSWSYAG